MYDARTTSGVEVLQARAAHRDTFRHPAEHSIA
jgi:hypothetical protein